MTIQGKTAAHACVSVPDGQRDIITVAVTSGSGGTAVMDLDLNHAEALELAIRAARLEAQARAVS